MERFIDENIEIVIVIMFLALVAVVLLVMFAPYIFTIALMAFAYVVWG